MSVECSARHASDLSDTDRIGARFSATGESRVIHEIGRGSHSRTRRLREVAGGVVLSFTLVMWPGGSAAQTTTTYKYDTLGRLVTTTQTNSQATVVTSISHDQAGNRKTYSTSGATGTQIGGDTGGGASTPIGTDGSSLPSRKFVVVPLNGFTVILIG